MGLTRILFVSDTHLGFDAPTRPRVERRRRGTDFFENYARALEPARRGDVDLVVHGGDVLYRSRVPAELVARAFRPLKEIADTGISVYVVPGNHERSHIPYALLAQHENLFVFDRPRTFVWQRGGRSLALSGFPYERQVRARFAELVERTGWRERRAAARALVMHHAVEGARVGPNDFTFTGASDVVRTRDIPRAFGAVLSGHIHRAQALTRHLDGAPLAAPVLYPGSIERTSFAEKDETKGYLIIAFHGDGRLAGWQFHELPARKMVQIEIDERELARADVRVRLKHRLAALPPDAVVQLRVGPVVPECLSAAALRALAPKTMNVSLSLSGRSRRLSSRGARPG